MRVRGVWAAVVAAGLGAGCALPPAGGRAAPGGDVPWSEAPAEGRTDARTGAAVASLSRAASDEARAGRFDAAAATLERAIRIRPDDAELWTRLAEVRLRQGQPRQAESTALKAAGLADASRADLKARAYRAAAEARRALGDAAGAREAEEAAARWGGGR